MGCCGSKKKVEEDPPEEPPPKEPEPPKRDTMEQTQTFEQPEEQEDEDPGPRKETLETSAPDEPEATQEELPEPEEEVTAIEGPSVGDDGKGEVEPIEPVLIPVTTKVDEMGPGDKNHVVVRTSLCASGGGVEVAGGGAGPNASNSQLLDPKTTETTGQNATNSDSYYTEQTSTGQKSLSSVDMKKQ